MEHDHDTASLPIEVSMGHDARQKRRPVIPGSAATWTDRRGGRPRVE
jgi:hypothetical protein